MSFTSRSRFVQPNMIIEMDLIDRRPTDKRFTGFNQAESSEAGPKQALEGTMRDMSTRMGREGTKEVRAPPQQRDWPHGRLDIQECL